MRLDKIFMREAIIDEKPSSSKTSVAEGGSYQENVTWVHSPERALSISSVYRAVNLLSSSLANLTLEYKRFNRAKRYFTLDQSPRGQQMNYLLSVRPNDRQNSYTFFKYLVWDMLMHGNAFALPRWDSKYNLTELLLLKPESVGYDWLNNIYHVTDTVWGINESFTSDEILHFKNMTIDNGLWGLSTIHYAYVTMGISATENSETLKRIATGGRFKAILQNNTSVRGVGEYQEEEMEGLGGDLRQALNRGDDILVMKGDGKLTPISMTSADLQFLDEKKWGVREIARFFNIPPSKLMDDTNSNYKSTEMSNLAFYSEALQPIATEIEREFNSKLVNKSAYQDYKFKFNLSSLYALDLDSKAKHNATLLQTGQATINDLRRLDDMEPIELGDDVYLSVNYAPIGSEKLNGSSSSVQTDDVDALKQRIKELEEELNNK